MATMSMATQSTMLLSVIILCAIKLCLRYGKNRAKLVGFRKQNMFFCSLKPRRLAQCLSQCIWALTKDNNTQHNNTQYYGLNLWHSTDIVLLLICLTLLKVALKSVAVIRFAMLSIIKLSVVMLSVTAPKNTNQKEKLSTIGLLELY